MSKNNNSSALSEKDMRARLGASISFGFIGNALFLAFGVICMIYYKTYSSTSIFSKILEATAYIVEVCGFAVLVFSSYLMWSSVRKRKWTKLGFSAYIVLEALMMIFELNSYRLSFYAPYSLALAVIHSIVSAAVCFSFLLFDPHNTKFEAVIIVCSGLILGGMFGNIMGIRIYFSIIVNALAYTLLFLTVKKMLEKGDIEIDCYGDALNGTDGYSNVFFDD